MPLPCYIKNESDWNYNRVSMVIQDCEPDRYYHPVKESESSSGNPHNFDLNNVKKEETVLKPKPNVPSLHPRMQEVETNQAMSNYMPIQESDLLFIVKHLQAAVVNVLLRRANVHHTKQGVWSNWKIENGNEDSVITLECKEISPDATTHCGNESNREMIVKEEEVPEVLQILSDPYSLQDCQELAREVELNARTRQSEDHALWVPANSIAESNMNDGQQHQNHVPIPIIKQNEEEEDCDEEEEENVEAEDNDDDDDDDEVTIEYVKKCPEKTPSPQSKRIVPKNNRKILSCDSSKSEMEVFNCYNKYCSAPSEKRNESSFQFCPLPEFALPQISANSADKEHVCKQCGKKFQQAKHLKSHERTHNGDEPLMCLECGKTFTQLCHLAAHKRMHNNSGEKPYSCQGCDKNFTSWGSRYLHERTHTGYRPHVCKVCGKSFTQKRNLVTHERTHSGERPYPCSYCSKRFSTVSIAKAHERIHTGEKPYSCRHCDKKFTHLTNLNTHERLHTGVKPYACTLCGKRFAAYSSAKSHARVHSINGVHPERPVIAEAKLMMN